MNSISYPTNRGNVRSGSCSRLRMVITVKAVSIVKVLPSPINNEKIVADKICGKKYRLVTIHWASLNLLQSIYSSSALLDSITSANMYVQLKSFSILMLLSASEVVLTRASDFFM